MGQARRRLVQGALPHLHAAQDQQAQVCPVRVRACEGVRARAYENNQTEKTLLRTHSLTETVCLARSLVFCSAPFSQG